ncbi:MAG: NADH-quinone oxidoreductase subunit L [Chloroflexi bacterium]|nr:NADH-quinone oxidoreductase subunit L [Chloroflexota bacterium]
MQIPELAAWFIFLLPLGSFLVIIFIIRPFFNQHSKAAGYVTILAIAAALVLSAWALQSTLGHDDPIGWEPHSWLNLGDLPLRLGILMDPLTSIMVVVVSGVSLMVQIYSLGYMRGDSGYDRYFAYMSLFTASMLGLVMASNIVQLYVFWELVGLCSYLLIGFWYHRPAAAAAAKKAFIVTRLGDFGFLLAILYLFFNAGTFTSQTPPLNPLEISDIYQAAKLGILGSGVVTWLAIGIFAGAVGKSGQFPLHTWLPDAMEGPTPVSALIHAATMVAAGVFLVARFFPLFVESPTAMNTVALIGGFTAVFAASMGLVMNDIKRVLAYSTISQLGYMMLALGIGAYGAAIFHLFTHAFFKALLFMGAGSVNHASGTFDMRYMGGLRKHMPWTYATFLIAGLSLAGIFPMAGFWSKDEILLEALNKGGVVSSIVFWLALIGVFMTAFYIFRALFMTFESEFRGGAEAESKGHGEAHPVHLRESPAVMVLPMVILGAASLGGGFLANPTTALGIIPIHWISNHLSAETVEFHAPAFNIGLAILSSLVAVAGIGLAYLMYHARRVSAENMARRFRPAYTLLSKKYYFDEAYEDFLTTRIFYRMISGILDWWDRAVVDGLVDGVGWFGRNTGRALALLQTGQVQSYGAGISIGILIILGVYFIWG